MMLKLYRYIFYRLFLFESQFKKSEQQPEIGTIGIMLILLIINMISINSIITFLSGYTVIPYFEITFKRRIIADLIGFILLSFFITHFLNLKTIINDFRDETKKQKYSGMILVLSYIVGTFILFGVSVYLYRINHQTGFTLYGYLKPFIIKYLNCL